jgi:hypothetical protein
MVQGMKEQNFVANLVLSFCLLTFFGAQTMRADSYKMVFNSVGGENSGGVYTYPYYFTVTNLSTNSTVSDLPLMCISFSNEIALGETWTATGYTAGYLGGEYEEAAYLSIHAGRSSPDEAQWAAWYLFDPGGNYSNSPFSTAELSTYLFNLSYTPSDYSSAVFYLAVPGSQSEGGTAQSFGIATFSELPNLQQGATPEPSSLLLVTTGMFLLAFVIFHNAKVSSMALRR